VDQRASALRGYELSSDGGSSGVPSHRAHVARKVKQSAIDDRTTRHPGYATSQQRRKLVEQVFGWMKTVGGLRKLRHCGGEIVDWNVTFAAAASNLIRMRTVLARPA